MAVASEQAPFPTSGRRRAKKPAESGDRNDGRGISRWLVVSYRIRNTWGNQMMNILGIYATGFLAFWLIAYFIKNW